MRVRASLGLKLPDDESEKGSALIETDSSATARVDPAETLISVGLVAADAGAMAPQNTTARPAHTNARKRSLELGGGATGLSPWFKFNIHSAPARGQQLLDESNNKLYEAF